MTPLVLALSAAAVLALSGVPGLMLGRKSSAGQWLATVLCVAAGAVGLLSAVQGIMAGVEKRWEMGWAIPLGRFAVGLDALSGAFLLPIFAIAALGSIYGMGYWRQSEHPANGQKLRFFWGIMAAALAMVVVARDGLLFLMAWEIMAVAAFFLVITEDEDAQVRQAGWVYLVAAHVGTLLLFAMFGLLGSMTGSMAIAPIAPDVLPAGAATALFVLALVAFGLKAGLMPLHFWLPGAHANAPSHVSAFLSGVLLKAGVYGLLRMTSILPQPPIGWGVTLLVAGGVSGVLGIAMALGQHDLKRLLAYSSVENIGIITMGIGLALVGRSLEKPAWVALGLGGAVLHVWNHSLFKPLLFFNAGAVIHATHTGRIDRMGGLFKRMPAAGATFLVGALAICGLPPLNGFVSELLIYLGLFQSLGLVGERGWAWPAFAAPVLALIGAMALACFVKVYGTVFLGQPRSPEAAAAHAPAQSMLGPMVLLAALCGTVGLLPWALWRALDRVIASWTPGQAIVSLEVLAPLEWVTLMGLLLLLLVGTGLGLMRLWLRNRPMLAAPTWGCAYAAPTARMQYTGSSLSDTLAKLFRWALWPRVEAPQVQGLFPQPARMQSAMPDAVLDRALLPSFRAVTSLLTWFRILQQGRIQAYVLYILLILVVLLLWG